MIDKRFEYTKQKLAEGVSQRQIARDLNVDHATIAYWIKNEFSSGTRDSKSISDEEIYSICKKYSAEYSYILGSYLGDGHITKMLRTYRLRIFNDAKYGDIIEDQTQALSVLFPENTIRQHKQLHSNCIEVIIHNKELSRFFPQHGSGKKHDRDVSLTDWQWDIVWKEPECFIKGLIDSDGSYVLHQQTINGVNYSGYKYQFTNKSLDIVDMYLKIMARLNISAKPTQKKCGTFNIFTNTKSDVEKLDKLYEIAENKIRSYK